MKLFDKMEQDLMVLDKQQLLECKQDCREITVTAYLMFIVMIIFTMVTCLSSNVFMASFFTLSSLLTLSIGVIHKVKSEKIIKCLKVLKKTAKMKEKENNQLENKIENDLSQEKCIEDIENKLVDTNIDNLSCEELKELLEIIKEFDGYQPEIEVDNQKQKTINYNISKIEQ